MKNWTPSSPGGVTWSRRGILSAAACGLGVVGLAGRAPGGTGTASGLLGHTVLGSGPEPVVVLHEWLGDHTNFDPMLPSLDDRRATWVFADLRGYGLSRHRTGAYTVTEAAGDVLALMDALGYRRFHIIGHSMSAMIAQRLAVDARDRVKSLVAIAPVPASGFPTDDAGRQRLTAIIDDDDAAKAAITARTGQRYGDGWLRYKLGLARGAASREAMLGYLRMFTGTDFSAETVGLPTPVLAVVGANDIALYREASVRDRFGRAYPNFSLTVCQDAGHYPMLETPVLLAATISAFVVTHGG